MSIGLLSQSNNELKKHVNTIHCSNRLTLVQRKLFNALLYKAYSKLPYESTFIIQTKELCRLIGYSSNDYSHLKKSLLGLVTTVLEWNIIDTQKNVETSWKASSILSATKLQDGVCTYEFSSVIRELLFHPEIYGKIEIDVMAKFKSTYGLSLYENCIRYQGISQTPWLSIEIFRELMGVEKEKHRVFADFKKRVINVAVQEVNKISPIQVKPIFEKRNRKVSKIQFKIEKKQTVDANKENIFDKDIFDVLLKIFSFSQENAKQIMEQYDLDYLKQKIKIIIESSSFQSGKIRGLSGYLTEALRKDYRPNKSSQEIISEKRNKKELRERAEQKETEKKNQIYDNYVKQEIDLYLTKLNNQKSDNLKNDFVNYIRENDAITYKWYGKYTFEHPAVKAAFNNFVKKKIKHVLSFDELFLNKNSFTEIN